MPTQPSGGPPDPRVQGRQIATSNATVTAFLGNRGQPSWMSGACLKAIARPRARKQSLSSAPAVHTELAQTVLPSPAPSDEPSPAVSHTQDSPSTNPAALPDAQPMVSQATKPAVTDARFVHDLTIDDQAPVAPAQALPSRADSSFQTPASQPLPLLQTSLEPSAPANNGTVSPSLALLSGSPASPFIPQNGFTTTKNFQVPQAPQDSGASPLPLSPGVVNGLPPPKRRRTEHLQLPGLNYQEFLRRVEQHICAYGGEQAFSADIEKPRLQLLKDACKKRDGFFLALHQLYCIWSSSPEHALRYFEKDPTTLTRAFEVIETILKKNHLMSDATRTWFGQFPQPIHSLLNPPTSYTVAIRQVANFLENLAMKHTYLTNATVARKYPFLVEELTGTLGCYSPVLQHILFTACRRRLGVHDSPIALQMEQLFLEDQKHHQPSGVHSPGQLPDQAINRRNNLVKHYVQMVAAAVGSQSAVVSSLVPSPQSGFLPPQPQTNQAHRLIAAQPGVSAGVVGHTSPVVPTLGYNFTGQVPPMFLTPPLQTQSHGRTSAHIAPANPLGIQQPLISSAPQLSSPPVYSPGYTPIVPSQATQLQQHPVTAMQQLQQMQQQHIQLQQRQLDQMFAGRLQHLNDEAMQESSLQQIRQQQPQPQLQLQPQLQPQPPQPQLQPQPQQQLQRSQVLSQQAATQAAPQQQVQQTQVLPQHVNAQPIPQQQIVQMQRYQEQAQRQRWSGLVNQTTQSANFTPQQRAIASTNQPASMSTSPPSNPSPITQPGLANYVRNVHPQAAFAQQVLQFTNSRVRDGRLDDRLLPPMGSQIPRPEWPHDPSDKKAIMMSLHQAHLRSPKRIMKNASAERSYQAVKSLAVGPDLVVPRNVTHKLYFTVTDEQFALASRIASRNGDTQNIAEHFNGSLRWRFRCCRVDSPSSPPTEQQWVTLETRWPKTFYMTCNKEICDVRRQTHNGKDLPVELTDFIVRGQNIIEISLPEIHREGSLNRFMAVEVLETLSHSNVVSLVWENRLIPEEETLQVIKSRLNAPADDDGVAFEAPDLSIDLADPFSSVIFTVPARGVDCTHMECFDLENWLTTRPSKALPKCFHNQVECNCPNLLEPTVPDKWRCPICFKDARPYSLRIDGFLLNVRRQLEKEDKLNAKSMRVKQDGSWTAVLGSDDDADTDEEEQKRPSPKTSGPTTAARKQEIEVIELD